MGLRSIRRVPKVSTLGSLVTCGLFVMAPDAGLCAIYNSPKTAAQPAGASRSAGAAMKLAQNTSPASKPAEGSRPEGSAASSLCDNNRCSEFEVRSRTTDILPGMRPEYRVPGITDFHGNFHGN
jgi:hypothetical protein